VGWPEKLPKSAVTHPDKSFYVRIRFYMVEYLLAPNNLENLYLVRLKPLIAYQVRLYALGHMPKLPPTNAVALPQYQSYSLRRHDLGQGPRAARSSSAD
jgi:hypothetical protein